MTLNFKDANLFLISEQEVLEIANHPQFPKTLNFKFLLALPVISEKTAGGILLTEEGRDRALIGNNVGRVFGIGGTVGCGKGDSLADVRTLKLGDYVKYNPHMFEPLIIGEQRFIFVLDEHISCHIPDVAILSDGIFQSYVEGVSNAA